MPNGDNGPDGKNEPELWSWAGDTEKHFVLNVPLRPAQEPSDHSNIDYRAELDGDYTISTVPAFTDAASAAPKAEPEKKGSDAADARIAPRPMGQPAFKRR